MSSPVLISRTFGVRKPALMPDRAEPSSPSFRRTALLNAWRELTEPLLTFPVCSVRRVGGMTFVRVGSLSVSYCFTSRPIGAPSAKRIKGALK